GISVGEELHRALEVGEEHGDLLALALEGALGGEDLLGEVLWDIRFRGTEARRCRRLASNRGPTLVAELRGCGQALTAGAAEQAKAGSAPQAEVRICRVLVLAPGTVHARVSSLEWPRLARGLEAVKHVPGTPASRNVAVPAPSHGCPITKRHPRTLGPH